MAEMTQREMASLGGVARLAAMTPGQKTAHARKMLKARWKQHQADVARAKRLKARKAGRIAKASRKGNRGT
jgi:hypothetical protein